MHTKSKNIYEQAIHEHYNLSPSEFKHRNKKNKEGSCKLNNKVNRNHHHNVKTKHHVSSKSALPLQ